MINILVVILFVMHYLMFIIFSHDERHQSTEHGSGRKQHINKHPTPQKFKLGQQLIVTSPQLLRAQIVYHRAPEIVPERESAVEQASAGNIVLSVRVRQHTQQLRTLGQHLRKI